MTPRSSAARVLSRLGRPLTLASRGRLRYLLTGLSSHLLRLAYSAPQQPPLVAMGAHGVWLIPIHLLNSTSVVYSVGVGTDISFDLEAIGRLGCQIHAFDPTPKSIDFITSSSELPPQFRFHPLGLWNSDTTCRFYVPENPRHVSHSIVNIQKTSGFIEVEVRRLETLMRMLGHRHVDLLRMNIEGAEYAVIDDVVRSGLRPTVIAVMLERLSPMANRAAIRQLAEHEYDLIGVTRWSCFTFLDRRARPPAPDIGGGVST